MSDEKHWTDWQNAIDFRLVGASLDAIRVSRYTWLTPAQSQCAVFPEYLIIYFTPFAKGLDGSWIGWVKDKNENDSPIVMSPRDEEFARVLGNSFSDGLFWILIEELQSCWLERTQEGNTVWRMREWLPRLQPILSVSQFDFLSPIARVRPQDVSNEVASFISSSDLKALSITHSMLNPRNRRIRQYASLDR